MQKLGRDYTVKEIKGLLNKHHDEDGDDHIDFNEFVSMLGFEDLGQGSNSQDHQL